jgi:hypothetical protein
MTMIMIMMIIIIIIIIIALLSLDSTYRPDNRIATFKKTPPSSFLGRSVEWISCQLRQQDTNLQKSQSIKIVDNVNK